MIFFDGFKEALVGVGTQFNTDVAVYDFDKCVEILMTRDSVSEEDALEWMSFNVVGGYYGPGTPVFLHTDTGEE